MDWLAGRCDLCTVLWRHQSSVVLALAHVRTDVQSIRIRYQSNTVLVRWPSVCRWLMRVLPLDIIGTGGFRLQSVAPILPPATRGRRRAGGLLLYVREVVSRGSVGLDMMDDGNVVICHRPSKVMA